MAARDFNLAVQENRIEEYIAKYNLESSQLVALETAGRAALTAGLYGGTLVLAFSAVPRIWAWFDGDDFDYVELVRDVGLVLQVPQ